MLPVKRSFGASCEPPGGGKSKSTEEDIARRPFPTQLFPKPFADMIQDVARATRVTEALPGTVILGMISGSLGRGLQAEIIPGKKTLPNLFVLPFAKSGCGKSENMKVCCAPFYAVDTAMRETWRNDVRQRISVYNFELGADIRALKNDLLATLPGQRESLRSRIAQLQAEYEKNKNIMSHEPQLISEDASPAKLGEILRHNGEVLCSLSSDPGQALASLFGRYGPAEALYQKAYSSEPLNIDRLKRQVALENPVLSLVWTPQPHYLDQILTKYSLFESGFISRTLMCLGESTSASIVTGSTSISVEIRDAYTQCLNELIKTYRLGAKSYKVNVTSEASDEMVMFSMEIARLRGNDLSDVENLAARYVENACRICLCLHGARHGKKAPELPIDVETVQGAIEIMKFFIDEQLYLFETFRRRQKQEVFQQIIRLIRENEEQQITVRDLQRVRHGSSAEECRKFLEEMVAKGSLKKVQVETGGRPSTVYREL